MNTKDFVVIPWGKPGNSVKLKYKKHAQELQMEKIQLELENQRMEETLREFQSIQNKGKEEIKSGGYHWKSGSVGKFGNKSHIKSQSKGNATKLPAGNVKLKLLKEQIEAPAKQLVNYKMAHSFGNEKPKVKKKVCGQCENKAALLVCLECGEDYCSGCFAKMHQKGALKFHRTTLLQAKSQILSNVLDVAHQFIKEANPPNEVITSTEASTKSQQKPKAPLLQEKISEVETTAAKGGEGTNPKYKPLCEMPFDEEASAKSFQEALTQWRAGQQEENKQQDIHATKPDSVEECEVQTNLKIWSEPINIEFTEDSLSYMEKLWLKKHRRTPQEQLQSLLPSMTPHPSEGTMEEQWSQNESDADSDVEEIKVQYPPLFMPVEKVNIKRPPPSLTIVELDSSHEAELEEPGDAVPYRVQLANAESQVSSTFPDYQNCFPRENSIHQHLVFNKGKSDLLSLCLRTHSTYHKDELKAASSNTDFGNTMESDIYSHEFKQVGETSSLKQNVTEKNKDPGNNQNSGDSSMPFWSKVSLPTADFDTYFLEENSSQDTSISLECSNPNERPNLEDSKITKSPLLLQDIALRKKPVNERYQGLEKFFTLHKNERLRSTPSPSLRGSHSCSRITFTEDKVWIPGSSLSEHAVSVVALCNLQSAGNSLPNMQQQKTGQKSQRPSTANFPVSSWAHKDSSCPLSSCPRSMSVAAAHSLSRAASEISEIEYIDVTDQNQPLLDNTADQQALDSLENELKVLRKLSEPSEKLQSLSSEELQAFTHHSLNVSQMSEDLLEVSCDSDPSEIEISSSGRNTEMQSLLSLGDYSTDEEEEDFLERQHVITLPWTKNV
ncbi:zinc finger B-box domain-containing protein 1 [Phodopus roborovskii]|uniref:zinc finger B-box domain-containing protein 1 n=1 Tax=Phodopus roborovskii TaxID=109678 RepID=UPI0021E3D901|nr:zinc finger B-box domain-containing protein 1 [Phodopus roborovskii]